MTSTEPVELAELRHQVRELVAQWRDRFTPRCDAWLRGCDPEFSRALAARGWIGLTWPAEYGGSAASNAARQVVTEELLRAGAPVADHWMGDRQIGPAILRYGTEFLKQRYLPRIASGELTFCLGMSETESGSDLASVRTVATKVAGGWRITGSKVWTSHAHRSTHAYVLARSDRAADEHAGLTEFIVDMSSERVSVRPIYDLRGDHHFNETIFDDVFVPDDHVLGEVGNGWRQVTEQLAFERGGMERVLSTYPLLAESVARARTDEQFERTGAALATTQVLRRLGRLIATEIDSGAAPVLLAAIGKDVGTIFEGDVNELGRHVLDVEPDPSAEGPAGLLADGILAAPGFTIRGGVTEVLRTIIARSGVRDGKVVPVLPPFGEAAVREMADDVLAGRGGEPEPTWRAAWDTLTELGWPGVGLPEELGGSGGKLADALNLLQATGRHTVSVPLAESMWAAQLLAAAGQTAPAPPATVAVPRGTSAVTLAAEGTVSGTVHRVPWARYAATLLVVARSAEGEPVLVRVAGGAAGLTVTPGTNLAGEPRDTVTLAGVAAERVGPTDVEHVLATGALLRAAQTAGAARAALDHTARHVTVREQFGKPLFAFQTVASAVAQLIEQVTLAELSVRTTVAGAPTAAVITGSAATFVARTAHQLHGAIGVTREHPLHLATRRLWAWRDECRGERRWAREIGRRTAELDPDALWDWVIGVQP
jgi:alkylation response protein AidB-like acyl-CoA dehydrogenase